MKRWSWPGRLLLFTALFVMGVVQGGGFAQEPDVTFEAGQEAVLQPIPEVSDKFFGQKVAIFSFVNKSLSRYAFLGNASSDFLIEFLQDAGFRTIEATGPEFDKIMRELRHNVSDLVDDDTAAQVGKHLGTNLAFMGSVTDFNIVKGKGRRGISIGGFGLGGSGGSIAYTVQVAGRLVDIETREILASKTSVIKKVFKVSGGSFVTPWGSFSQDADVNVVNETGGRILQQALNDMMIKMVKRLNRF